MRRMLAGMSQDKLGESLHLTFQQIQKYEKGSNRISASRLYDLSRILEVPVQFFFDDLPGSASREHGWDCQAGRFGRDDRLPVQRGGCPARADHFPKSAARQCAAISLSS